MASRKHYREAADAFNREYNDATTDDARRLIERLAREMGRVFAMEGGGFRMQSFMDAVTEPKK